MNMKLARINAIAITSATAGEFRKQVEAFISQAMLLAADGLTLAEGGQLLAAFVELAVNGVETLEHLTGEQKKQAVLEVVSELFDYVGPMIWLPWWLAPFRRFIREPLRNLVLDLADGLVEVFVAKLDQTPDLDPA